MTPKQKAIELVDKFYQLFPLQKDVITNVGDLSWEYDNWKQAKKSALIAVDELLKVACPDTFACKSYDGEFYSDQEYFEQVKKEIEKL